MPFCPRQIKSLHVSEIFMLFRGYATRPVEMLLLIFLLISHQTNHHAMRNGLPVVLFSDKILDQE